MTTRARVRRAQRPPQPPYVPHCTRCGARWSGTVKTHCGACHLTFTGAGAFDRHRVRGECVQPAARGLVDREGIWGYPGTAGHWARDAE